MIKPIETEYNGYKFRSRLEARWAVYFDTLGIKYEYEPEGYDFEDGSDYYIPDFYLPQVKMFAEVKPEDFTKQEMDKVEKLVYQSKKPCLLLIGQPDIKPYKAIEFSIHEDGGGFHQVPYALSKYHDYINTEGRFYCMPSGLDDGFDGCEEAVNSAKAFRFEYKS